RARVPNRGSPLDCKRAGGDPRAILEGLLDLGRSLAVALALLGPLLAGPLAAQNPEPASYPNALAGDQELLCWANTAGTALTVAAEPDDLTLEVVSGLRFCAPTVVTIGTERIKICAAAEQTLTVCEGGRGFEGSAPAAHFRGARVAAPVTAYWFNRLAAEMKAVQDTLGPNLTNVPGVGDNPVGPDSIGTDELDDGTATAAGGALVTVDPADVEQFA